MLNVGVGTVGAKDWAVVAGFIVGILVNLL
jgi:hypothetical protein